MNQQRKDKLIDKLVRHALYVHHSDDEREIEIREDVIEKWIKKHRYTEQDIGSVSKDVELLYQMKVTGS